MKKTLATIAGLSFCAVFMYFVLTSFNNAQTKVATTNTPSSVTATIPSQKATANSTRLSNTQTTTLPKVSTRTKAS
ncbi:MAG: hypothetical protein KBD27_03265 [Candidatus Moranbacteria bacterium]|nr:hypothetical protein [Candidatus Moranbacteria bacterium]